MGSTLQNIYLFPAPEKKVLVAKLQKHYKAEGYKTAKADEEFDVTLRVISQSGKPCFIGVDATDSNDTASFARSLADSLGCDLLFASVFDSDFLSMVLVEHESSEVTVLENGFPEYTDEYVRSGDISRLHRLLAYSGKASELGQAWEAGYAFAEERLADMLTLLGCDSNVYTDDVKARTLRFINRHPEGKGYEIIREGLPGLKRALGTIDIVNRKRCNFPFRNSGGPSKGFTVILSGELVKWLTRFPESISEVEVSGYNNPTPLASPDNEPDDYHLFSTFNTEYINNGEVILKTEFTEAPIPNGLVIDMSRRYNYRPAWSWFERYYDTSIIFTISLLEFDGPSGTELVVQVIPHGNKERGVVSRTAVFWPDAYEYGRYVDNWLDNCK